LNRVAALAIALACAVSVAAQAPSRIATTAEALIASAVFFQGRTVVVRQKLIVERDLTRLASAPKPVYVFWKDQPSGDDGEVRGEFFDLGRIEARDSRFTGYDLVRLVETVNRGQWPARDEIFIITGASLRPSEPPKGPTLRAIALAPDDYEGREVKVSGRFKGRNLYGDLPFSLAKSKWDFVMQSAEGALWVTGIRPKGKDFDLDPSKRVDTGRWVQVTGVVRRQGVTPYIEGTAIALAAAPEETPVAVEIPKGPPQPPPNVIFSAPIQDDQSVDRAAPVRIQFSRDIEPRSLRDRILVTYVAPAGGAPAVPPFTATYNDAVHAVEIKFAQPLAQFQQVKVELLAGITALDGQALAPWTLVFTTGR
jgi:hypothetical protein